MMLDYLGNQNNDFEDILDERIHEKSKIEELPLEMAVTEEEAPKATRFRFLISSASLLMG